MKLAELITSLRAARGLALKRDIAPVAEVLGDGGEIRNGDDAAAIPDEGGYILLAAEGMLPEFVAADPWFAGFCAVMVNVSDIAAMGGRPSAVVDVLFSADAAQSRRVLEGMRDAARVFAVPLVGGHTSRFAGTGALLAAAIVGRARKLITSFAARPGDALVLAVDLRGSYRGDTNYFDAATCAPAEALRTRLAILPELAEAELVHAGKDVSMAGIAGTLVMLCEGSGVGATLDLDAVPRPADTPLDRWLRSFPSYGFVLAVAPEQVADVRQRFSAVGVTSAQVGQFRSTPSVELRAAGECAVFWDLAREALTGFGNLHGRSQ